jgi:(p)ppGpp synthase/HD superfamily hydrolase
MGALENDGSNRGYRLGTIESERGLRLDMLKKNGAGAKSRFLATLQDCHTERQRESILTAYNFACAMDYAHPGRTAEAYLAHPLRVAEMVMSLVKPAHPLDIVIALLHNVLEVTEIPADELGERFGATVMESIIALTVDRAKQWDPEYKRSYYRSLRAGYAGACAVKVLDKLDNIFLLCLNPNAQIRTRYLDEIDAHVVPLATDFVPAVSDYMRRLSANARAFGHLQPRFSPDQS